MESLSNACTPSSIAGQVAASVTLYSCPHGSKELAANYHRGQVCRGGGGEGGKGGGKRGARPITTSPTPGQLKSQLKFHSPWTVIDS